MCLCVCVYYVPTIKRKPLIGMTWNLALIPHHSVAFDWYWVQKVKGQEIGSSFWHAPSITRCSERNWLLFYENYFDNMWKTTICYDIKIVHRYTMSTLDINKYFSTRKRKRSPRRFAFPIFQWAPIPCSCLCNAVKAQNESISYWWFCITGLLRSSLAANDGWTGHASMNSIINQVYYFSSTLQARFHAKKSIVTNIWAHTH